MNQLRTNATLRELITGSTVYCLVWEVFLLILTERKLYHSVGILIGLIVCVVLEVSMAQSIDVAVDLDEKGARTYLQKKASLRYVIVCAVVVAIALTDIGNPLTFFAGIMGIKAGAYMQPLTHKVLNKINNKRGETADE